MAASGAIALVTRGHSDKLVSAADAGAGAKAPQANAAATLALVRNQATLPMKLLSPAGTAAPCLRAYS
jgi:hypothetical protein